MRGEDVENDLHLSELNVLGENKANKGMNYRRPVVTDGNGASPLLSVGNEGENKNPLNTNISATG